MAAVVAAIATIEGPTQRTVGIDLYALRRAATGAGLLDRYGSPIVVEEARVAEVEIIAVGAGLVAGFGQSFATLIGWSATG